VLQLPPGGRRGGVERDRRHGRRQAGVEVVDRHRGGGAGGRGDPRAGEVTVKSADAEPASNRGKSL
jgi:hypothetical protein